MSIFGRPSNSFTTDFGEGVTAAAWNIEGDPLDMPDHMRYELGIYGEEQVYRVGSFGCKAALPVIGDEHKPDLDGAKLLHDKRAAGLI